MFKNKKGFTFVELIVVIAILGVLTLLAGPKLLGYVEKAELTRIQHDVKVMEQEMKIALIDGEVKIAHWGQNKKNLGALVMQDKLFEKEGVAERIDATSHLLKNNKGSMSSELAPNSELGVGGNLIPINGEDDNVSLPTVDETYKIVPSEYKGVIGTRLGGTFYTNDIGKVYYEHDKPILGQKSGDKILDCPLPLPDYNFEPETGTIVNWYGTATHLVIPEAFKAIINGEEQCVPVRIIGAEAFMQGELKSIVIPQSVIRIEFNAFKDNLLTTINIPHSVNYIGGGAFSGNDFGSGGGGSVTIRNNSSNITIISGAFGDSTPTYRPVTPQDLNVVFYPSSGRIVSMGAGGGSSITIPESFWVGGVEYPVKQIDKGAYQGLGLISVILPSSLERIEDYAFAGNQLEGITIPDKVNHIGHYAFAFNEVEHTTTGHRKATIGFINIKNEEQFSKVNQYGDILDNDEKVSTLEGAVKLLDHIFVTSIGNIVIDEEYVEGIEPEDEKPEDNNDNGGDKTEGGGLTNPVVSMPPKDGEIPINSAEELANIGKAGYPLDGKYILTSNIDLSSFDNWLPIGSYTDSRNKSPFTGSFNGNGYNITGLKIYRPATDYVGLFGYTEGAIIENVALEDVNVTGRENTGGLVGSAIQSSKVTNSYATGSVTGTGDHTGGLVGFALDITNSYATSSVTGAGNYTGGLVGSAGKISDSYATGAVTGTGRFTGGLAGYTYQSTIITRSYAIGSVTGRSETGGLVGYAVRSTVTDSYATGSVSGTGATGGLVGYAWGGNTISNSYATGSVTGGIYSTGGLVGTVNGGFVRSSSYWDRETTGQSSSAGGGTGKSTIEMKMRDTYKGWDFDTIWQIDEGKSYPTLK